LSSSGALQIVALRNAPRERAHHFLPVAGNPAKGYEKDTFAFTYALEFLPAWDWNEDDLAAKARVGTLHPWVDASRAHLRQIAEEQVNLDRADVWVMADKPATRGRGRILRLYTPSGLHQPVVVTIPGQEIKIAYLCDARERDLEPLEVRDGRAHLNLPGTISTIRLIAVSHEPGERLTVEP
jgi:alpha-mannosidase